VTGGHRDAVASLLAEAGLSGIGPPADDAFAKRLADVIAVVRPRSLAIGWATVDLERAEEELVERLALQGTARDRPVPPDELLGASCRLLTSGRGGEVLLLEPSTEGRLAAALARFGEGVLAIYLRVAATALPAAHRAGLSLTAEGAGPVGRQRLVLGGPRWGPHVLLVAPEGNRPARHNPAGNAPASDAPARDPPAEAPSPGNIIR